MTVENPESKSKTVTKNIAISEMPRVDANFFIMRYLHQLSFAFVFLNGNERAKSY